MSSDPRARWFYLFILLHLFCWTLAPILIRYNLPLDAMEGTTWGHQLALGYDKNPFMNAWLTRLAIELGGNSGWTIYLFSQLSVVICFWAVWQLARDILTPVYALMSVMLLEAIQYYNLHAIDFNDNTLELSLWALTILFCYRALQTNQRYLWIFTGLFAGLGMMAKYYTLALIAALGLFILCDRKARARLTTASPYFGLITFLLIILPHSIWLCFHDFMTVTYVFARASTPYVWTNHFTLPGQFLWDQFQAFLPALILYGLFFLGRRPLVEKNSPPIAAEKIRFLLFAGLGPFILTLLLSLFFAIKLRGGWGMPLLSLWGIILFALLAPRMSRVKYFVFVGSIFLLLAGLVSGYMIALTKPSSTSSANFPGREIAQIVTDKWHQQYHQPLDYVAGPRWLSGNVAFYSQDQPAVLMEWNFEKSFWINEDELRKHGAVFIWDADESASIARDIVQRYPELTSPIILTFQWKRSAALAPIRVGVMFLPPMK